MYSFPIWSLSKSVEPPARFSRNFLYIWFPTRNLVPAWPRFAAVTRNQGTCRTYPHSCPWKVTSFLNGWLEHRNPTLWLLQLKKRGSCRCSVQKSWEFCRAASLNTVIFYRFPASTPIGYMICIIYIYDIRVYIYYVCTIYTYIPQNSWWNPYERPVHVPWIPSGRRKIFAQGPKSPHMAPPFCALGHSECSSGQKRCPDAIGSSTDKNH